jgi:hypothetical protein
MEPDTFMRAITFLLSSNRASRDESPDKEHHAQTARYGLHDRRLLSCVRALDGEVCVECHEPRLGYLVVIALQISPSNRFTQ